MKLEVRGGEVCRFTMIGGVNKYNRSFINSNITVHDLSYPDGNWKSCGLSVH